MATHKRAESLHQSEHIGPDETGDNIDAKRIANYVWNSGTEQWERMTPAAGGGGGTQYTEDAADGGGSTGTLVLAVRDDAGGSRVGTDGDFTALSIDSSGRLRTVVSGAGSGGTSSVDDSSFTVGTDAGTGAMGIYQSSEDSVNDGDIGVLGMTADRHLKVEQQGDVNITASSLPLPTGAATSANQATIIGHVDGVESLLATIDSDTSALAGAVSGSEMQVDIVSSTAIPITDNSGSITVDNATLTSLDDAINLSKVDVNIASQASDVTIADGGNSITVDGTVTANLSATDNGVLDDIVSELQDVEADVEAINTTLGGTLTVDGSSVTQPVSGTVTANLGATDNAVLDDIAANQTDASQKTQIVDGSGNVIGATSNALDVNIASGSSAGTEYDDGDADATPTGSVSMGTDGTNVYAIATNTSGHVQVDVQSSALPSGASTAANQSTVIGHVDGIETLLGTIDADTSDIHTNTDTIAGAVSGSEMQVDVVTIPEVAINDGGNTITVDGTVTANLSATDNAVLDTIDAVLDQIKIDTEAIETAVEGTLTVDGSGVTQPVSGTVTANLSATDNAVLDSIETTLNSIESGQLADGHNVTIDNASIPVTDNGGSLTVDGTVTANLGATDNAVLDQIEANTSLGSTSAVTSVSGSASSVQLLASNTDRKEAIITNDSTADLYVKLGTTASTTSYTVKLKQDETFTVDSYYGRIDGIWSSATGNARITEID